MLIALCAFGQTWVSQIVVFGDSLSDTGNFYRAVPITSPPWPYPGPKASNGPLAVEKMADIVGVQLHDFAWFGATTGLGNYRDQGNQTTLVQLPGMTTAYHAANDPVDSKAIYVVWAGPNDFLTNGFSAQTAATAVTNIIAIVTDLQRRGAKHILVPGMPDIGLTPFAVSMGIAGPASALTDGFNALLLASMPRSTNYFDTAAWMRQIIGNPAAYGLTNVTGQCFNYATWQPCSSPDTYFFWDEFHPTTKVHAIMGELFAACAQTRSGGRSSHCRSGLGPDPK